MSKHNWIFKWLTDDLEGWECSHCGKSYIEPDLLEVEDCHVIWGDVIADSWHNIIVHQVNHQGVMGAGLALQIKNRFPPVYARYFSVCKNMAWETIQEAGGVDFVKYDEVDGFPFYVANLFGQRYYGNQHLSPDYGAMRNGLKTILRFAVRNELSVAIPYGLGCGLGKGNWSVVLKMIEDIFTDEVEYNIYRLENK